MTKSIETTVTFCIDGKPYAAHITIDPPSRATQLDPYEPMCVMVDEIEPELCRQITESEYNDIYTEAVNFMIRNQL